MKKERFTRNEFDRSRSLLRSFVSDFHFGLFEALEKIEDLRCIVDEDEDTGDVFYCFIKHYNEYTQRVALRELLKSEVEAFIFEEFQWSIIDANYRSKICLRFQINDNFSVLSLSEPDSVYLLLVYLKRDILAFEHFDIHPMSKISLVFLDADGDLSAPYSSEEFEIFQPVLFYYLMKNGLLQS